MPNDGPPPHTTHTPAAWITPSAPPPAKSPVPLGTLLQSSPQRGASITPSPAGPDAITGGNRRAGQRRRSASERQPTPDTLRISLWADPLLAEHGYPATGFYVERYFGPVVGPTCIVLYRTLARRLEADVDGFSILTATLARSVGCSSKNGAASQFWRALRRAHRFGLLRQHEDQIFVRSALGLMSNRMAQRLPLELRHEHRVWVESFQPGEATELHTSGIEEKPPEAAITLLRSAARGLCTPEELRLLDRERRIL
ncbi:MAG: hypothetical protein HKN03_13795 [Acidimicrobiales bacterium]|nr:hypothetical protein [Acidimicrobiales bacterium]